MVHETVDFVHNVLGKSIVQQVCSWPTITFPAISVLVLSLILLSYTCHQQKRACVYAGVVKKCQHEG